MNTNHQIEKKSLFSRAKVGASHVVTMVYKTVKTTGAYMKFVALTLARGVKNFFTLSMDARIKSIKRFAKEEIDSFKRNWVEFSVMFSIICAVSAWEKSWSLVIRSGILFGAGILFDFVMFNV